MGSSTSQEASETDDGVAVAKRGCSLSFLGLGNDDDDLAPGEKYKRRRSKGDGSISSTPSGSPVASPRAPAKSAKSAPPPAAKKDLEAPLLAAVPEDSSAAGGMDAARLTRWAIVSCTIFMMALCAIGPSAAAHSASRTMQSISEDVLHGTSAHIDYTIRLTGDPDYCIAAVELKADSLVHVTSCDSVQLKNRQFTLGQDGVIHLMAETSVCVSFVSNEFRLRHCEGKSDQVWTYRTSGEFELQSLPNMCMNVKHNDYETGALCLYQCQGGFGDMFAYGGGHFLTPGLIQEFGSLSQTLEDGSAEYSRDLGIVVIFSLVACVSLVAAAYHLGKLSETTIQISLLIISILLIGQCILLVAIGPSFDGVSKHARVETVTELDYTLRLSSHPSYCMTSQTVSPFLVSIELCEFGDQSQQFIFENSEVGIRLHPQWKPSMCISLDAESKRDAVVLRQCEESRASRQVFTNPRGTGGSLPLINSTKCLNLLNGDVDAGELGFWKCSGDIDQIFVYSQGNPTVARLLQQLTVLVQAANTSMQSPYLLFFKSMALYLTLGVFVPALWCFFNFDQAVDALAQ